MKVLNDEIGKTITIDRFKKIIDLVKIEIIETPHILGHIESIFL
jgi:hypothetical protein